MVRHLENFQCTNVLRGGFEGEGGPAAEKFDDQGGEGGVEVPKRKKEGCAKVAGGGVGGTKSRQLGKSRTLGRVIWGER